MTKPYLAGAALALAVFLGAGMASAGPIERACYKSGSASASRATCGCIQQVADMTLRGSDQRRAAKLMKDPDLAHEVWISKRESDDEFWDRYKTFGDTAAAYCGG